MNCTKFQSDSKTLFCSHIHSNFITQLLQRKLLLRSCAGDISVRTCWILLGRHYPSEQSCCMCVLTQLWSSDRLLVRPPVSKSAGLVAQPSLSLSTHSPLAGRKVLQNAILALERWCEGVIVLGGTLPSSHLIKLGFMLDRNWVKKERRCLYHVLCEGVGLYLWPGKGRHKPFWMWWQGFSEDQMIWSFSGTYRKDQKVLFYLEI